MHDHVQMTKYRVLPFENGKVRQGPVMEISAESKRQAAEFACERLVSCTGKVSELCAKVWVSRSTNPEPEYFYAT